MSTKQTRKFAVLMTFCTLTLLLALSVAAQTFTATLTGTVTDQNSGALPNAKVIVTNQGTKLEYTATTTDAGIYTLPFLPVGNYVITVETHRTNICTKLELHGSHALMKFALAHKVEL